MSNCIGCGLTVYVYNHLRGMPHCPACMHCHARGAASGGRAAGAVVGTWISDTGSRAADPGDGIGLYHSNAPGTLVQTGVQGVLGGDNKVSVHGWLAGGCKEGLKAWDRCWD
jgi:hypothetical protein